MAIATKERLGEPGQVHQHHTSHDLCAWRGADRVAQEAWLGANKASAIAKSPGLTTIFHFPWEYIQKPQEKVKKIIHVQMHPVRFALRFQCLEGSSALPGIPGARRCGFCKGLKYMYGDYVTELLCTSAASRSHNLVVMEDERSGGMNNDGHHHTNHDHDKDVDDVVDEDG